MAIGTHNDVEQHAKYVVELALGFRINGVTTPDGFRDGKANLILTVVRNNPGLFTVTLKPGFRIPFQITHAEVGVQQAAAPTADVTGYLVRDTYNPTTRAFQVATRITNTGVVGDPDDNDIVTVYLRGPGALAFRSGNTLNP
jgi:hypothetical protein